MPQNSYSSNNGIPNGNGPSINHHSNLKTNQQTITITDTPSPAVITISDSEDETPEVQQTPSSSSSGKANRTHNSTGSSTNSSSSTCRANNNNNSNNNNNNGHNPNNNSNSNSNNITSTSNNPNNSNHQNNHSHSNVHHPGVINSSSSSSIPNTNNNGNSNRQRKNVISCVTVGDSDGEDRRSPRHQPTIKYEPHVGQSQKKRLLAMAQNECLLSSSSSNQLHVPKQEPAEFSYEYPPQVDKRSSWAPPAHHNHHKRESSTYLTPQQAAPPMAHAKNSAGPAWGVPIYRQQHQSNTPLGGSPGNVLQQDIYAQSEIYRRPTVFVSQAPYQSFNRVVPPPAHNGSSRQVLPSHPLPAHIQFPTQYSQFGPLSPQVATKHGHYPPTNIWFGE
jgi:homeodomain interacting protein kinase